MRLPTTMFRLLAKYAGGENGKEMCWRSPPMMRIELRVEEPNPYTIPIPAAAAV
jgi:hypothetical protein